MPQYPNDWLWFVGGDMTQFYSSAVNGFIAVDSEAAIAWLVGPYSNNFPSTIPTLDELLSILNKSNKTITRPCICRFTVAANVVTMTPDTIGITIVSRISIGRYRLIYEFEDTAITLLPTPSVMDTADIRARVTARTATYAEVRTVNSANAAVDVAGLLVTFDRVVSA